MNNILIIIFICVLAFISVGLLLWISDYEDNSFAKAYFSWLFLACAFIILMGYIMSLPIKSSESFKIDTIVNTKVVNGIEIERDTIYILTKPTKE